MSLVDNGPTTVPEPPLGLPLGIALVGLAGYQWRRTAERVIERVWKLTRHRCLHNRYSPDLDKVIESLCLA